MGKNELDKHLDFYFMGSFISNTQLYFFSWYFPVKSVKLLLENFIECFIFTYGMTDRNMFSVTRKQHTEHRTGENHPIKRMYSQESYQLSLCVYIYISFFFFLS